MSEITTNPFPPEPIPFEAADFILRAVIGLLHEDSGLVAYTGPDGVDQQDYDEALVIRAADTVGRDRIKSPILQRYLAELDSDQGGTL